MIFTDRKLGIELSRSKGSEGSRSRDEESRVLK
jgi:hypothetical protein